jgi:phosphoribosyl 1,2-cyclic phosphodiesterase
MRINFWGVRGSVATSLTYVDIEEKIRRALTYATPGDILTKESVDQFINGLPFSVRGTYGGSTTCLELETDDGSTIILDAGTGLRSLGNNLLQQGKFKGNDHAAFLMTHSHWDHLQGLLFFVPFYMPGNKFSFYSAFPDIEDRIRYQNSLRHFPIAFDDMASLKDFNTPVIEEGEFTEIFDVQVTCKAVRHPGGCYSYKIKNKDGKTFIFCTDTEFNMETMENIDDYLDYFEGADLLVFDTQYTFEESLNKIDWGHSSAAIATDIAMRCNVKKLILFHHDPSYSDEKLDAISLQAINYRDQARKLQGVSEKEIPLQIKAAYEGLSLEV